MYVTSGMYIDTLTTCVKFYVREFSLAPNVHCFSNSFMMFIYTALWLLSYFGLIIFLFFLVLNDHRVP